MESYKSGVITFMLAQASEYTSVRIHMNDKETVFK